MLEGHLIYLTIDRHGMAWHGMAMPCHDGVYDETVGMVFVSSVTVNLLQGVSWRRGIVMQ